MARDMSRDHKYFNCKQEHELRYVSGLYPQSSVVHAFLKANCDNQKIHYSTHMEIYQLIEKELGFPIPIES